MWFCRLVSAQKRRTKSGTLRLMSWSHPLFGPEALSCPPRSALACSPPASSFGFFWLLFFVLFFSKVHKSRRQGREQRKQSSHSQTMLAPLRFRALRSTVAAQFSLLARYRARSEIVAERRCAATRVLLLLLSCRSRRPGFSGFWLLACVLVFFPSSTFLACVFGSQTALKTSPSGAARRRGLLLLRAAGPGNGSVLFEPAARAQPTSNEGKKRNTQVQNTAAASAAVCRFPVRSIRKIVAERRCARPLKIKRRPERAASPR